MIGAVSPQAQRLRSPFKASECPRPAAMETTPSMTRTAARDPSSCRPRAGRSPSLRTPRDLRRVFGKRVIRAGRKAPHRRGPMPDSTSEANSRSGAAPRACSGGVVEFPRCASCADDGLGEGNRGSASVCPWGLSADDETRTPGADGTKTRFTSPLGACADITSRSATPAPGPHRRASQDKGSPRAHQTSARTSP
jgi:hypothetical protein